MSVTSKLAMLGAAGSGVADAYFLSSIKTTENHARGCAFDPDGNMIVVGSTLDSNSGAAYAIKYDVEGNILWKKEGDGNRSDWFLDVTTDDSGNVYAVGYSNSDPSIYTNPLLVKFDSDGNVQWQKTIGPTGISYLTSVRYFSGSLYISYIASGYAGLMKVSSSSGSVSSSITINSSQTDTLFKPLAVDASGNVAMAYYSTTSGKNGMAISLFNSSLGHQWSYIHYDTAQSNITYGVSCAFDSSGNLYALSNGNTFETVIKINPSTPSLVWQQSFSLGDRNSQTPTSISIALDGNVMATGGHEDWGTNYKAFFVAYSPSGSYQWSNDVAYSGGHLIGGSASSPLGSTAISCGGYKGACAIKVPSDGSGTGTYGSFTYAAVTKNTISPSLTFASWPEYSSSAGGYSTTNDSLTFGTSSLSPTTYPISV